MALLVDTDNALGSSRGDVDDGFALAYLLQKLKDQPFSCSFVSGNASADEAKRNTLQLVGIAGRKLSEDRPADKPVRVLALGPLTNVAALLKKGQPISEIICVGGNLSSRGRFPPVWPMEFNFTKDLEAAHSAFESSTPLTIVPLDVARAFRMTRERLNLLRGCDLENFLRKNSLRWLRRCLWLKGSLSFAVWDFVAACYVGAPYLLRSEHRTCTLSRAGLVKWDSGGRVVKVITGFEPADLWDEFLRTLRTPAA